MPLRRKAKHYHTDGARFKSGSNYTTLSLTMAIEQAEDQNDPVFCKVFVGAEKLCPAFRFAAFFFRSPWSSPKSGSKSINGKNTSTMSKKKNSHTSAIGADGKFFTVSKEVAKQSDR